MKELKKKEKDEHQEELERREQGFTLYVNGPKNPKNPKTPATGRQRRTKTAGQSGPCVQAYTKLRDWSLITGGGGLQNGRGGHVKFYPYERGGGKSFGHAEGGAQEVLG